VARFLSVDPIGSKYPMLTPYQFASNRPIQGVDLDGLEYKDKSYYSLKLQTTFIKGINTEQVIVEYNKNNRPDYFKINDIYPERASPRRFDGKYSTTYFTDNNEIRPDYSAFKHFAQASATELDPGESKTYRLGQENYEDEYFAKGVGTTMTVADEAKKWTGAFMEMFGEKNRAYEKAFKDKVTFYQSINLVNNYFGKQEISAGFKIDLINFVNSGQLPFSLKDLMNAKASDLDKLNHYNSLVSQIGKDIYDSGQGNTLSGTISTKPADKNAIPYH
jgi:hypothetical protein